MAAVAPGSHRQAGEDRLAMISGALGRALAQFPELWRESVIHAESLSELLRHIFTVRAAGVQVHFLEDTNVRMSFPHSGHDAFEVLAAVDIPVKDPRAGAGRDICRIGAGVDNLQRVRGRGIGCSCQGNC